MNLSPSPSAEYSPVVGKLEQFNSHKKCQDYEDFIVIMESEQFEDFTKMGCNKTRAVIVKVSFKKISSSSPIFNKTIKYDQPTVLLSENDETYLNDTKGVDVEFTINFDKNIENFEVPCDRLCTRLVCIITYF